MKVLNLKKTKKKRKKTLLLKNRFLHLPHQLS